MDVDERTLRLALLGEAAGGLAHELRNVLQTIAVAAYLAEREGGAPVRVQSMARSARRGLELVEAILAVGRGEQVQPPGVPLRDLFADAREGLPDNVRFVDEPSVATPGPFDPVLFPRLLHVLYENAGHAAAPNPVVVTTRVEEGPGSVAVLVEDDGPGVPAALVDRLFEPFSSQRAGGTGLGLALARRIARAHGGELAHEGGARFRATVPTLPR